MDIVMFLSSGAHASPCGRLLFEEAGNEYPRFYISLIIKAV